MNFKNSFTKKISFILIVSILSLNLSFLAVPKQAEATWPSFDYGNFGRGVVEFIKTNYKDYLKAALASMAKALARQLILKVTASTVDWINGGMQGNPAYLADFNKFMTGEGGVIDRTVGDFVSQTGMNFLCDPFKAQVSLALQVGYNGFKFKDQIGCTLTNINRNINNAIKTAGVGVNLNGINLTRNDAGNNTSNAQNLSDLGNTAENLTWGGWSDFLDQNVKPQNNAIGSYLIAKSELDQQVQAQIDAKKTDVANGGGAESFQVCTDQYFDKDGNNIDESKPYNVGTGENTRPKDPGYGGETQRQCTVKTPGSAITAMLGFKATQDQRMNELTGALADGIDAIFSALVGQILTRALTQVQKGVLDNGKDTQAQNNAAISSLNTAALTAQSAALNAQGVINDNSYLSSLSDGNPIPSITNAPNILVLPQSTTSTSSLPTQTFGTGGGALDQARNNSIVLINSLSKSEFAFQNNYLTAQNILTRARDIFASSSLCNINFGRTSSVLRSVLIRANVTTNIEGIASSDRTIASIPWNLPVVSANASTSNAHMLVLSTAANTVNSAPTIADITTAMIPVNSTNFNTDPQTTLVPNIKTWLSGVQGMYNSTICPIDLTNVMKINSATSTGN